MCLGPHLRRGEGHQWVGFVFLLAYYQCSKIRGAFWVLIFIVDYSYQKRVGKAKVCERARHGHHRLQTDVQPKEEHLDYLLPLLSSDDRHHDLEVVSMRVQQGAGQVDCHGHALLGGR